MTLVKFANGQKNNGLNPLFTDVFDSILNDTFSGSRLVSKVPAVNIAETENEFHIELAVPGLAKEDFKINVDKNILSVSAEKKIENAATDKKYSKKNLATTRSAGPSPCLKLLTRLKLKLNIPMVS